MTHQPLTVHCENTDPWGGYSIIESDDGGVTWYLAEPVIHFDGAYCGALQNVLTPGPRTNHWLNTFEGSSAVGVAIQQLAHEATHVILGNSRDEGLVECTAYRNVWNYIKMLPINWKQRQAVYLGAKYEHFGKPTTGEYANYRSVC